MHRIASAALTALLVTACSESVTNAPNQANGPPDAGVADAAPPPKGLAAVASNLDKPTDIAVDGNRIFWTSSVEGRPALFTAPRNDGEATLLARGLRSTFAAFQGAAYYCDDKGLRRLVINQSLTTLIPAVKGNFVSTTDARLLWLESDTSHALGVRMQSIPRDGGTPENAELPSTAAGAGPLQMVAYKSEVFVTFAQAILYVPTNPVSPTFVNAVKDPIVAVAADDGAIYVASPDSVSSIQKADLTVTKLSSGFTSLRGIALDNRYLYVTDAKAPGEGAILRILKTGGKPVIIAEHQGGPSGIAVDDAAIYWTATDEGVVRRFGKTTPN